MRITVKLRDVAETKCSRNQRVIIEVTAMALRSKCSGKRVDVL